MGDTPYVPRVGGELAGYRLESVLQRGGMSVVYAAEHLRMGRRVALKILATELADDDRFRERFINESRIAASIDHPNIIPIYDAGEENGVLYIAMHYVAGSDLKALIDKEAPLELDRCVSIMSQVAGALDAAHRHGLIHRDIKPGNILVVLRPDDDSADHIYLSDFGLTKHNESHSALTPTGQFMGTVDYVAPEQIEGKAVDARADIYSLGCVLYECLTGVIPFLRDDDVGTLWAHLQLEPPKVTEKRPDVPTAFDDVIATAMAKSPDDRYGGCRAFLSAIRTAVTTPQFELPGDPTRPAQHVTFAPTSATPQLDHPPGEEQPSQATRPPVEQPSQATHPPSVAFDATRTGMPAPTAEAEPAFVPPADDRASDTGAALPAAVVADAASGAGGESVGDGREGRWRRRRAPLIALLALLAGGVAAAVILLSGTSSTKPPGPGRTPAPSGDRIAGNLAPVPTNHVNGVGDVAVRLNGDVATVSLTTTGLLDGSPHPIHIHAGGQGICPPGSAAKRHNGHLAISTLDGLPFYGPPVEALTTSGDTSAASILALRRFPKQGNIRYTRQFELPKVVAAEVRTNNAVVVVHGADYNHNGVYDNALDRSDLNRSLPGELTTPALCGPLVAAAKGGSGSGTGTAAAPPGPGKTYYASLGAAPAAPAWLLCPLHPETRGDLART
jgi:serine/threonine protein kinase